MNSLRYKTEQYKVPAYQVCAYSIMNPPGGFTSGKVYMKFTKIESGVTLYLTNEKTKKTQTIRSSSSLITEYEVENGSSLTLSAVPKKESFNTTFVIEYWTDGVKNAKAKIFTELADHKVKTAALLSTDVPENKGIMAKLPIIPIAAGAGACVVLCICFCLIKKCRKKEEIDI